ncbi:MAG: OmpA family protein [Crocinitomicaceae bacterium]|nr:OmpA family protein [Crocinitomicaceae bacterium]
MKIIKTTLLALVSLFVIHSKTHAQDYIGLMQSNYAGIMGADLQPASLADNRFVVDVNVFSLNISAFQDYKKYPAKYFEKWWWNPSDTSKRFQFNYDTMELVTNKKNRDRSMYTFNQIDVLNFMFTVKENKIGIGAGIKIRSVGNASGISPQLIGLAETDFQDSSLWFQNLNEINLGVSAMVWNEYFFNYAQVVMDKDEHFMKVGGRFKFLQGIGSAYTFTEDLKYEFINDSTAISVKGKFSYGYNKELQTAIDDIESGGFSGVPAYMDLVFKGNNFGGGVDLGVVYEWRPKWKDYKYDMDGRTNLWRQDKNKYVIKAGLAFIDIGAIGFERGFQTRDFLVDEDSLNINIFDDVKDFSTLDSVLINNFDTIPGENKYVMTLPATLSLQFDWNIWNDFYLNVTSNIALNGPKFPRRVNRPHSVTITPRYDHAWFGLGIPLTWNSTAGFRAGFSLRAGPFFIGTSNMGALFKFGNLRGADIYAGVRVPILHGHPRDRDEDKVSDKRDMCVEKPGIWQFRGCPDADLDGIPDKDDICPATPGIIEFKGCPDTDGDGIPDKEDDCPDVAGLKEFNGCPDTDGDGITDALDSCVTEPGPKEFNGCPDRDGDGIKDADDLCPDHPGPIENQGCPDTDGDGIFDYLDDCPTEKGPKENHGCPWPDTDGDGLLDKDDRCPYKAGPIANHGCPYSDTDKDGIIDSKDDCPMTPGVASTEPGMNGCPVIEKEIEEILKTAFDNLEFQTARAIILEESFASLDELAAVLAKKPNWTLVIAGHTDNQGAAQSNLILSKKRAEAVKAYLVEKGANGDKLVVEYYGETKPIADNNTPEGRQKNRRVEMTIKFD